jgi:signal transduction histidine kinase
MSWLTGWPNWSLPVKLGLVMLVPVLVVLALGALVINTEVTKATEYTRADRIVELSVTLRGAITALQQERQQVAGAAPTQQGRTETDSALNSLRGQVGTSTDGGDLDPVATTAWTSAQRQLDSLPSLRGQGSAAIAAAADRSTEVGAYTQLVNGLFAFDRVLATDVADAQLARESMALYDLASAREEVLYQQSVVLAGIGHGTMSVADVTSLHGSEARLASRVSDFHAVAGAPDNLDFSRTVTGPSLAQQASLLSQAIDQSGGMSGMPAPGMMIEIPASTWNAANSSVVGGLDRVVDDLTAELRDNATSLRSQAGNTAGTAAVALVAALLAAIAVMVVIARQLLRSINVLRRTARDVATRNLPDAVERIRAGETVDTTVRPVPVYTEDEVGQLARAFDAVHGEALRLAVEQANLRANYSELFVNLSRRSQSLVQRQLRLIEQLERDEEDPDQLSALFKLDHLATRMRRNNENLMVLSGTELSRGPSQPVSLADLLRAAVSEIEHYERVNVQPPPDIQVLGYAAGDLVRLIAELLDNATAFSSPDSQVTLASHRTRSRAIVVDIVDHGIGMNDEELARANDQLTQPEGVEERVSRRMGMFVVSKLANRHGVRVRLHGGQDIPGLRVTVTLPTELILGDIDDVLGGPLAGTLGGNNGSTHGGINGGINGGTNGVVRSSVDEVAGALTVTIPQLPSAESTGVSLFAPIPGEDDVDPVDETGVIGVALDEDIPDLTPPKAPEVTPIFNDILSAWFADAPRARPADADEAAVDGEGPQPDEAAAEPVNGIDWEFAADDAWRAVDAASQAAPDEFTTAGLPKRQPRAKLLPGSVDVEPAPRPVSSTRLSPDRARARLSGFQRGIARGREEAAMIAESAELAEAIEAVTPMWPTTEQAPEDTGFVLPVLNPGVEDTTLMPVIQAERPVTDSGSAAEAEPATEEEPTTEEEPAAEPAQPEFPSGADEGWRAANPLVATDPEITSAGLPKRRPRAKLVPGGVAANGKAGVDRPEADAVRDRITSFQRGVRQGRNGSATAAAERVEHGYHLNTWENE